MSEYSRHLARLLSGGRQSEDTCTRGWLMITRTSISALILALTFSHAACADGTLYERLGGEPVVARVVEQTIGRVAADPRLNQSFDKINLTKLNAKIVEQVCAMTGGGCRYSGDGMKVVHAGLDITEREFYGLVAALRDALDDNHVGEREKNELLRLLAPMKRDVVTR